MVSVLHDTQLSSSDLEIELSLENTVFIPSCNFKRNSDDNICLFPFINRDNIFIAYKVVKIKFAHASSIDRKDINRIFKNMKWKVNGIFDA